MAVSAAVMIRTSMQDLGVLGAGETADGLSLQDGLRRLAIMMAAWSLDPLTVVQTDRMVFPITPNKGTYTIGPQLDFDTARPTGQESVVGAGLLLTSSTPPVEIPRSVITYSQYQSIQVKDLTSSLFTAVFYKPGALQEPLPLPPNPNYVPSIIDKSQIILWPVPLLDNPLVLYIEKPLPLFQDLTTLYPIPDNYQAAIQYNLTVALAPMFSVQPSPEVVRAARLSLAAMKRTNYQMIDVGVDPMFTMQNPSGGGYNIETGGTQRRG